MIVIKRNKSKLIYKKKGIYIEKENSKRESLSFAQFTSTSSTLVTSTTSGMHDDDGDAAR